MTTTREIKISTELQIEKPPLSTNGRFYRIYSLNKFVLRPNEIKTINLGLKIKLPDGILGIITLLRNFIEEPISLENSKWITSQTCNKFIVLTLWNRNFHCSTTFEKKEEIVRLFLIHRNRDETFLLTCYKLTY